MTSILSLSATVVVFHSRRGITALLSSTATRCDESEKNLSTSSKFDPFGISLLSPLMIIVIFIVMTIFAYQRTIFKFAGQLSVSNSPPQFDLFGFALDVYNKFR